MINIIKWILLSFLLIYYILFAIFNHDLVTINLFPSSYILELPIFILIMINIIIGYMFHMLISSKYKILYNKELKSKDKIIKKLQDNKTDV